MLSNSTKTLYLMRLSEFKTALQDLEQLTVQLPTGESVPAHFHLTEMGLSTKRFVDCGGTYREERYATLQLWVAGDVEHRLAPSKLLGIIEAAEKPLELQDEELRVEYQGRTVEVYALDFADGQIQLKATHTDCLAQDHCGIAPEHLLVVNESAGDCCSGGGCC